MTKFSFHFIFLMLQERFLFVETLSYFKNTYMHISGKEKKRERERENNLKQHQKHNKTLPKMTFS